MKHAMKPDIIAEVRLFPTDEGGRKSATPAGMFACRIQVWGRQYDCRFLLDEIGALQPGASSEIPIKFLSPEAALEDVKEGDTFKVLERGTIGEGRIVRILF